MARRRGDAQPTDPVRVVLISPGPAFRPQAIARAIEAANGQRIAVVVIARIHGSSFGFPNPGLMPNPKEKAAAKSHVEDALAEIRRSGGRGDGQVAIARSAAKIGAKVARLRQAALVVVDEGARPPWRKVVDGNTSTMMTWRLRGRADVESIN
jgi:nucleotide-binding universal stress UspA family protein